MIAQGSTQPPALRRLFSFWLGPVVVFALSCLVFEASAEVVLLAPAWKTFEFCQYAEIGRNIVQDGAYNTRLVEPMALAMIDRDEVGPKMPGRWPVVNRYPLPCFVIAGLMRACGTTDYVAAWSNGLAVGLLAALLSWAVRSWFGTRWAMIAALLWLSNPSFYGEFILLGTPDVWFATIFLAEILVWAELDPAALRVDPRPVRWRWAVGLGVLGGLTYLARFNAAVFVALQVAILGLKWRRWREALIVVGSALVIVAPILIDTWRHFGRPTVSLYSAWNLLDDIGAYQVEPWLYYKVPNVASEVLDHLAGVRHKVEANLRLLAGPSGVWVLWRLDILIPLGVMGVWFGAERGSRLRRAAALALGLFVFQLILFSGLRLEVGDRNTGHNGRYFFWFAPFALILGLAIVRRISGMGRRVGRLLAVAAVVAQLVVFGFGWESLLRYHLKHTTNFGQDPVRKMLAEVVQPDQVIASDQPQITAWLSGLRSISLPADPDELDRLNRNSPTPVDYIFIDSNFIAIDLDPRWGVLADPRLVGRSAWELRLLRNYKYVLPPAMTRPIGYVLLRRSAIAPSAIERAYQR